MTQVKGTALAGTLRYIGEKFGPAGMRKVLDDLTPEEKASVEAGILASAWYPFDLLLKVMRSAHRHFGAQVPRIYHEIGRASAEYALKRIYKIFFKVGSPQFIIAKGSTVLKTYYSTGEVLTPVVEKGHAILELVGFEDPALEFCERLGGWMERTIELSGGKGFRLVHDKCRNRGDDMCRFEGWWS